MKRALKFLAQAQTLAAIALLAAFALPARGGKLIFAVDIIRHGDRSPIRDLPKAPTQWPLGRGQLTALGQHQEFELGSRARALYVDQEKLLPSHYVNGTMYVRSTDIDRTLMSAECFLTGLYPPGTGPSLAKDGQAALPDRFQPIPIHTLPHEGDTLLIPDVNDHDFEVLMGKYVFNTPEWIAHEAKARPMLSRWTEETGYPVARLYDLLYPGDTLHVDQLYHQPLPPGMTVRDAKALINAGQWAFVEAYSPLPVGRITGTPLLKVIGNYLHRAAGGKSPLKYVLFSAHDSTIMSVMSALGTPLDDVPHYASRMNFSLYETAPGKFRIDVSLNGQPVVVPEWKGSSCEPPQFDALVKENAMWVAREIKK